MSDKVQEIRQSLADGDFEQCGGFGCKSGEWAVTYLLEEVDRLQVERERLKLSAKDNCTCGGSGPGERGCVACEIYHDVFTPLEAKP